MSSNNNNNGDNDSIRNLGDDSIKNGGETSEQSQKAVVDQDLVHPPSTTVTYAKQLPNVTKIEVFGGQNFRRWHERVHSILDMYGVAFALSEPKPPSSAPQNITDKWAQPNKVCRHTILSTLYNDLFDVYCSYKEPKTIWDSMNSKYTVEDTGKQKFVVGNYYRWEMTEDKDIKIQINEYHKLLQEMKAEKITLPDEFVARILIEKLSESWSDYKNQLKHKQKQLPLADLITHIIIEDTNRREIKASKAKSLVARANMVQNKATNKRCDTKRADHNNNKMTLFPVLLIPTILKEKAYVLFVESVVIMLHNAEREMMILPKLKLIWLMPKEMILLMLFLK
jgi:hypothetical protein